MTNNKNSKPSGNGTDPNKGSTSKSSFSNQGNRTIGNQNDSGGNKPSGKTEVERTIAGAFDSDVRCSEPKGGTERVQRRDPRQECRIFDRTIDDLKDSQEEVGNAQSALVCIAAEAGIQVAIGTSFPPAAPLVAVGGWRAAAVGVALAGLQLQSNNISHQIRNLEKRSKALHCERFE